MGWGMLDNNITVVVPFYNRAAFFERLIQSVEAQSLRVDKLLIVDNGSRFNEISYIWPIILKSTLNVVLVSTMKSGNANFARNLGFELAEQGMVAFLDSDDWWDNCHLKESVSILKESPYSAVYSGARIYGKDTFVNYSTSVNELNNPFELIFSKLGYIAQTSSYIVKKGRDTRFVKWDESLKRHQDFDFFLSLFYFGGGWDYSPKVTVNIDWEAGGTKVIDGASKLLFFSKWKDYFPDELCKYYLYTQILYCVKTGDKINAVKFKSLYISKYNSVFDRLLIFVPVMYFRNLCIYILEKSSLKNKARALFRTVFK